MNTLCRTLSPVAMSLLAGLLAACAADAGDPEKRGATAGSASASGASVNPYSASRSTSSSRGPVGTSNAGTATDVGVGAGPVDAGGAPDGSAAADAAVASESPTSIEVEYYTVDPASGTTSQPQCDLKVVNVSARAIALSDVTLRYWFTADGNALSSLYFISYYSQNSTNSQDITASLSGAFAAATGPNITSTSDSILDLSFASPGGQLAPDGGYAVVQVAIHGPGASGYSDEFIETNDYSFDPTKTVTTSYQPWTHVTAYVGGQIVWGAEPGAPPPSLDADSGSTAGDGAVEGSVGSSDGAVSTADATVGDAAVDGDAADDATLADADAAVASDATATGDGLAGDVEAPADGADGP